MEKGCFSRKGANAEVVGKRIMEGEKEQLMFTFWGYHRNFFKDILKNKRRDSAGLGKGLFWGLKDAENEKYIRKSMFTFDC